MAMLATRNEADALDLVQEAMIKLVRSYSDKPLEMLKPLFLKILENGILDWHRREKLKNALFFWRNDDEESDTSSTEATDHNSDPVQQLNTQQTGALFMKTIEALPLKQQQCFLLRSWEGLSVKETAEVMNINENSVKTHYFRAMEKLRTVKHDV